MSTAANAAKSRTPSSRAALAILHCAGVMVAEPVDTVNTL